MKTEIIKKSNISEWMDLIHPDLVYDIKQSNTYVCGCTFLGGPQGVVIWSEEKTRAELKYIYVSPDTREMGIGTSLIRKVCAQLYEKGIKELSYSFSSEDSRISIEYFLDTLGGVSDVISLPYGSVTFDDIKHNEKFKDFPDSTRVTALSDLLPSQKSLVSDMIELKAEGRLGEYASCELSGVIFSKNNKDIETLLLVNSEDNIYHVEYLSSVPNSSNIKEIVCFINEKISKMKDSEGKVLDAVLASKSSLNMFKNITDNIDKINFVQGFIDTSFIAEDNMYASMLEA
ncbi:MAG: GNAT family N-acetyltransferase [Lachnospiraceae bacterium]|nr:GNAT family N-acetyltransferase [Lachnospiraceae bacterium]